MQAYGSAFARVYNLRWGGFAQRVAPQILDLYAGTPPGRARKPILDLCCGTGQLALHFLEGGYHVTGVDLSEDMLHYARENTRAYIESGLAQFVQADASRFALDQRFGMVASTFDALNHLADEDALRRCFVCVYAVLETDGTFVFDLNTREGLKRWSSIRVDDTEEVMVVSRGVYDGEGQRAYTQLSGFVLTENGLYQRSDETVYNTFFDIAQVGNALMEIGWQNVSFRRGDDLTVPTDEPKREPRVFILARK